MEQNINQLVSNRLFNKITWRHIAIILALIVLIGYFSWWQKESALKLTSEYQAVFLTNGQVYFGTVTNTDRQTLVLDNVYYLQVLNNSSLQGASETATGNQADAQMSLVKLGNELHGPEAEMYINRKQILFIENLKPDSQIVESIRQAEK